MSYVYQSFERGLWTVGFYDPSGVWHSDSDHNVREDAAKRVRWLNGGMTSETNCYLVFSGDTYYPNGGAGDYKGQFDNLNDARYFADRLCVESGTQETYDWTHVALVTRDTMMIVYVPQKCR